MTLLAIATVGGCSNDNVGGQGDGGNGGGGDGGKGGDGGSSGNGAPRAVIQSSPRRLRLQDQNTLTLDGRGSTGAQLSYHWDLGRGSFLSGTTADSPMVQVSVAGTLPLQVKLTVKNALGMDQAQTMITVNQAPQARIAGGLQVVPVGQAVTLDASGSSDPDNDPLTYSWRIVQQPTSATLASTSPTATLTPPAAGVYLVEVTVSDGSDQGRAQATVMATPKAGTVPPVATLQAGPSPVNVGDTVTLTAVATTSGTNPQRILSINGQTVKLNGDVAQYTPATAGRYLAVFNVTDEVGGHASATAEFFAHQKGATNSNNLSIDLTAPDENTDVVGPADIIGTATGDNFAAYKLEARQVEVDAGQKGAFRQIGGGASAVVMGKLGVLDPRHLFNDTYELRLTAYDTFGNGVYTSRTYVVNSPHKTRALDLVFVDAEVNTGPVAFQLARKYHSQDKATGDFGVGWRLSFSDGHIEVSGPPGDGWTAAGGFFSPEVIMPLHAHRATVRIGNSTYRFFFNPQPVGCFASCNATARFDPLPGTAGTLVPDGDTALTATNTYTFNTGLLGSGPVYNPTGYTLTTPDLYQIHFGKDSRIDQITDADGNVVLIDADGIHHGPTYDARLTRDGQNRITKIALANGSSRTYQYDMNGDLAIVTDFAGSKTVLTYDQDHDLTGIFDADGKAIARYEYDGGDNLTATIDGAGNRIVNMELPNNAETVSDRLGQTWTRQYDNAGNLIASTDPLGGTVAQTFDANGNALSYTDAMGNKSTFTYNANGHLTSRTDPLLRTTTFTYDANGNMLQKTDPAGGRYTYAYDAGGHLSGETRPDGSTMAYTYNAMGRLSTVKDPVGNTISYAYDGNGQVTGLTDAGGSTGTVDRDGNGNPSGKHYQLDTGAGIKTMDVKQLFSSIGRPVSLTPPEGGTSTVQYNLEAGVSGITDAMGRKHTIDFNDNGIGSRVTNPDGTAFSYMRDANDRIIGSVSSGGENMRRQLDAVGRVTRQVDSAGNATSMTYDLAGHMLTRTNPAGGTEKMEYDAAGQLSARTTPDGARVEYTYDMNGRATAVKDPLSRSFTATRDAMGRLTSVVGPDGKTRSARTYDAMGRTLSVTDATGGSMHYDQGPYGVTKITDATGGTIQFKRNSAMAVTQVTDATGGTQSFQLDSRGRILARTLPSGKQETRSYDPTGSLVGATDFTGQKVTVTYDGSGRRVRRQADDGTFEEFGYTSGIGVPTSIKTPVGSTAMNYDPDGHLMSVMAPDGTMVSYSYTAGLLTEVNSPSGTTHYTRDTIGRITQITGPDGKMLNLGYDLMGRTTSLAYPDGVTVSYAYDTLTDLPSEIKAKNGAQLIWREQYSRDLSGRITQITEDNGPTRSFTYDLGGRLLSEQTSQGTSTRMVSYTYDAAGNRLTRTDDKGTQPYAYDADQRLTSDGTYAYAYDAAGRLTQRKGAGETLDHSYDGFGRLVQVARTGGTGPQLTKYRYHAGNVLWEREVDGKVERYLHDYAGVFRGDLPVVLEERDMTTGKTVRNLLRPGAGRPHVWGRIGTDTRYLVHDSIGTVRQVLDASGASLGELSYDAFGNESSQALPDLPYRFAGERFDGAVGLYDMRARRYQPSVGRFTSRDRMILSETDPWRYNPYHYAAANPVNNIDPSGDEALIGYLFVLDTEEKLANAAAGVVFAALLSTKPTGPPSGTISTTGSTYGVNNIQTTTGTVTGPGFTAHYRIIDCTDFPPVLGVAWTYQPENWAGFGDVWNVPTPDFFEGVGLFSSIAFYLGAPVPGGIMLSVGTYFTYRVMALPNIFGIIEHPIPPGYVGAGGPVAALEVRTGFAVQTGDAAGPGFSASVGLSRNINTDTNPDPFNGFDPLGPVGMGLTGG